MNPTPPKNLSRAAVKKWRQLRDEYSIDDAGGLLILRCACECFDRVLQCREILDREGMTVKDRFGQPKAHPMTTVERDCRASLLAALKQLNLDIEPLRDGTGRPGGRK